MSNVELSLHIYQRPVQGSGFLGQYRAYQYRHSIIANGGFDTASCTIELTRHAAQAFLEDRLGCRVAIYADNPVEPIWEGFINRVTVPIGAISFTVSLDEMINRVSIVFTDPDVSTTAPQITTTVNNTASQAIYGVKEGLIEGHVFEGTTTTRMDKLRDTLLAMHAFPQKSIAPGGAVGVQIEMLGWYHTLDWAKYYESGTLGTLGSRTPTDFFTELLPLYPNSSFFSLNDFSLIQSNTSWLGNRRMTSGRTFLQQFQSIQETGDGTKLWIWGIKPTGRDGVRKVYFHAISNTVKYTMRTADRRVRDLFGRPVKPYLVQPNCGVRMTDTMLGWTGAGDDPREFYASEIQYDAERHEVVIPSSDNITPEGVFQLKRHYKRTGKRFGAAIRQGWP